MSDDVVLLLGEVFVDFTVATGNAPVKMRLGGIVHAARGLWACNVPYAVAAICPTYLRRDAEAFLMAHGCVNFFVIANVDGAPNIIVIGDQKEIGHQGYEDILRDSRRVEEASSLGHIGEYKHIIIFPGAYSLASVAEHIHTDAQITIDVAYGIQSVDQLSPLSHNISDIAISTSSELFSNVGSDDISNLTELFKPIASRLLLKENRGGSRLFNLQTSQCEEVFANLRATANSVGVGDVYTAVFASFSRFVPNEAVWRGMQVATRYAQTTFPDDLKRDVQRELLSTIEDVKSLCGVFLPWHDRPRFEIYLAAPDFTYVDRTRIEAAIAALTYHNFTVRRPVLENGESKPGSPPETLHQFYYDDVELLRKCSMVFSIPLQRDPGTLVEMGMAMALGIPVVTYDPNSENENIMVMCGSNSYSSDLDLCVNATFESLSKVRRKAR